MNRLDVPVYVATISALVWGLWWVPLLWLESLGLNGLWAGAALNAGAVPLCLALVIWREGTLSMPLKPAIGAMFVAGALTLYSGAIIETSVVRAVLLFYLAPAWAIAIDCLIFGRRFRWINAATLLLAALGFLTIFRFEIDTSALNLGDVMAIISGMSWAVGASLIFSGAQVSASRLSLVTCSTGVVIGIALALTFETSAFGTPPATAVLATFLIGTVFIAPIMIATLWSARRLPPATISFLLTAEVISGVASAALILGAPLGVYEAVGAVLIVAAALSEVASARSQKSVSPAQ